jgi:hypothetical protein
LTEVGECAVNAHLPLIVPCLLAHRTDPPAVCGALIRSRDLHSAAFSSRINCIQRVAQTANHCYKPAFSHADLHSIGANQQSLMVTQDRQTYM